MIKAHDIAFQEENVAEIQTHVRRLLKAAGVGNKLPTPKEDIVECAKLVALGEVDLRQYAESWPAAQ